VYLVRCLLQKRRGVIMSITEEQVTRPEEQTYAPPPAILHQPEPVKEQPPGRGRRWFIIAMVLVLLLIGGVAWVLVNLPSSSLVVPTSNKKTSTFTVGVHPQVVVQNDVGITQITGSSTSNEVTITESKWNTIGMINLDDIRVSSVKSVDGNTITVTVARLHGTSDSNATGVNLDITVPHSTELSLVSTRGSIEVTGVRGQMMLKSNTGDIQVTASILNGSSILATQTGSLDFNGTTVATDANGTCTYQFLTILGPIRIALARNSAFDLDASNRYGVIESNVQGMTKRLGPTQFEAHGSVGNPPRAHVIVMSRIGSIQVNTVGS
jgi:hypothetical protein